MTEDATLLQQYAQQRSEPAFGELVARHINLVYSTALRTGGGDVHFAQDITQAVFIDLARKAGSLPENVPLAGWLHRHTCFTAANAVRTECRRRNREQIAMEMNSLDAGAEPRWEQIAPHLDAGLNELNPDDRHAIVLRFLDRQDFRAIGGALGISEDAAQKRVSRALDKLREVLGRRGVALPAAALASVLAAEAVTAAPAGLAVSITTASLATAATAAKGAGMAAFKFLAMTKLQLSLAGAILVAGVSVPLAIQHESMVKLRAAKETAVQTAQGESNQISALAAENQRLSNLVARAIRPPAASEPPTGELLQLRGQNTRLMGEVARLNGQLAQSRMGASTNSAAANPLQSLLKNPAMKGMLEQTYDLMAEKQYGALWSQLHLTPDQITAFRKISTDEMMQVAEPATSMYSGNPADASQATQAVLSAKTGADDKIHQLLGDDGFAQYQEYEKTVSQRMILSSFKDSAGAGGSTLTPDQENQLLQVLVDEQDPAKMSAGQAGQARPSGSANGAGLTDEQLNQSFDSLAQANQRILARATNFLAPAQLDSLQSFLAKEVTAGRATLQMMRGMSSGGKN
jgi:RNA polymerase sigma factor (sigma-70 family)